MEPWIDRMAIGIVVGLMAVGVGRAVFLASKGVRVVVVERRKPVGRALGDTLALGVLVVWFWLFVTNGGYGLRGLIENPWLRGAGLAILASGATLYCVALFALGRSWRIGTDPGNAGPLVTSGPYAWSRHPIYAALLLVFAGASIALGGLTTLLLGGAACCVVHGYALHEERFLTRLYGDAYREYSRSVGRYLTVIRKPRA